MKGGKKEQNKRAIEQAETNEEKKREIGENQ